MRYRKLPVVIEATQWFKNGDHPKDKSVALQPSVGDKEIFYSEGKIVRYYRKPECDGERQCNECREKLHIHGWIDTSEGGHIVCPGDWIITGVEGENYPCKPDIFRQTYEPA